MQLHLACSQRIGVIIVGPPGSGKSTLWKLLRAALMRLNRAPYLHIVNPKAMPRHQLLGAWSLMVASLAWLRAAACRAGRLTPNLSPAGLRFMALQDLGPGSASLNLWRGQLVAAWHSSLLRAPKMHCGSCQAQGHRLTGIALPLCWTKQARKQCCHTGNCVQTYRNGLMAA